MASAEALKQKEMKAQIARYSRINDYYQLFGISRDAQETEIKKAYRRLAMKFHPDKNHVEGAKKVFEKVSNAYRILSDVNNRAHYDRFGEQRQQQPTPTAHYQRGHMNQEDFARTMFEQFFGPGFAFQGGAAHAGRGRGFYHQQQGPHFNVNLTYLIGILILMMGASYIFKERPSYSLSSTSQYNYKRTTPILKFPFYVETATNEKMKNRPQVRAKIQFSVDRQQILLLWKKCENVTQRKNSLEMQARYNSGKMKQTYFASIRALDMSPCKQITDFQQNYPDYSQQLFSYYYD